MTELVQIQTTTDQREAALAIAEGLVDSGLAACVQIGGPLTSVYRWQGNIETDTEWLCTAKTSKQLCAAVEDRIRSLHSYDEPEILATEVVHASASYRDWLLAQLTPPDSTD